MFDSWPELKKHTARRLFGHPKAKRNIRRHDAEAKKKARRQHPTIRQANKGKPMNQPDGWANQKHQPWNKPGRPVGVRYARAVRDLESDRYWE